MITTKKTPRQRGFSFAYSSETEALQLVLVLSYKIKKPRTNLSGENNIKQGSKKS